MSEIRVKKNWQRDFFDKAFYAPSSPSALAHAGLEAAFLAKQLCLKPGMSVLDVACGQGRHSVLLAKKGFAVTGVDITDAYLADARKLAAGAGVKPEFVKADMRRMNFKERFDGAFCAFTSFGYFDSKTDLAVLKRIYNALKPGGLFIVDVIDRDFIEEFMLPRDWHELPEGGFLLEEHDYDPRSRRMNCRWVRIDPEGGTVSRTFAHNVYSAQDLKALLKKAGFTPLKSWNSFSQEAQCKNRAIVLARKPATGKTV